ncbi:MAG: sugar transferase [Rhodocyclaceae bacterium]|nr:sugar transferase [Rhodocyclaceae bacterium]MDZ4216504.1 sugar transferase [Rhodocyclaceae bacterium]
MNANHIDDRELQRLERRLMPSARQKAQAAFERQVWRIKRQLAERVKRGLDIVLAGTVMLMATPAMLVVALLIKLTDGGPVLFWQTRVGKWGQTFRFPKFRSMVMNAEALQKELLAANQHGGDGITFKMRRDPRITWIGRIIRKTSIDELPQLWCVLKGDMSLVGPRPAIEKEVARYSLDDRRRLDAMPGLTCTWQVSGRSNIPFPEQVRLDVDYIERQSLAEDFRLLLKTIPAVITGRGAY